MLFSWSFSFPLAEGVVFDRLLTDFGGSLPDGVAGFFTEDILKNKHNNLYRNIIEQSISPRRFFGWRGGGEWSMVIYPLNLK